MLGSWCRGRRNAASTYGGGRTRCHSTKEGWVKGALVLGIAEAHLAERAPGVLQSHYQVTGVNRAVTQVLEATIKGGGPELAFWLWLGPHSHLCLCLP